MSKKNSNVLNLKNLITKDKIILNTYSLFKKSIGNYKKKKLVAAISGGPDSLALAGLLKILEHEKKTKVFYVLVDHSIRMSSQNEAQKVKILLKKHKISLKILKNKKKIDRNIQSIAREVRYELLSGFCKKNNINHILTAHHRDDQVETFLIRLSRGSGIQGLSGMDLSSSLNKKIKIIRPLLDFKKENLIYVAKKIFGKYFKDPSNKNKKNLRTKIRNLKKTLENSGLSYDQILKSIKNLSSTRDTLNKYISSLYKENVSIKKKKILVKYDHISNETTEIQLKLFGKILKNYTKSYYPPRSKKILNLIEKLRQGKIKNLNLSGCSIQKIGSFIEIKKLSKK